MKKKFLIFLLVLIIPLTFVSADVILTSMSMNTGYSQFSNGGAIGLQASYDYYIGINSRLGIGFGMKASIPFLMSRRTFNLGTGIILGPSFYYLINQSVALTCNPGFAIYMESPIYDEQNTEFMGLGPGLDFALSFFPQGGRSGFIFGVSNYFTIGNLLADNTTFSYAGFPYIGMVLRMGPANLTDVPVISYYF